MPIKTDKASDMANVRPPPEYLKLFWTLAEGTDEKRTEAAIQLVNLIKDRDETTEKEQITAYCLNRLIRGLGSGRKFARVGYSTALTLLLRQHGNVKTSQVFTSIRQKLKADGHSFSKAEKAGLYLGRAFAFSCLIQAGRVSQFDGDMMSSMVDEILSVAGKRSYLKPVCSRTLENLISQVSVEAFGDQIWPKIRDSLTLGWEGCTLDRISLLLVAKQNFPEIVNKKFIKKYWGFPIFSEENDEKLVQAIINSTEKTDLVTDTIIPFILSSGRAATSVWSSLGEKLYGVVNEKKQEYVSQRQLQAVSILTKLISLITDPDQILSLIVLPSVMKCIFQEITRKHDPFSEAIQNLVKILCAKLKALGVNILHIVEKVFGLEGVIATGSGSQEGKLRFVLSSNFLQFTNMLDQKQAKEYVTVLIGIVKKQDKWKFLSKSKPKQERQIDWCLRQLQIMVCSQIQTSPEIQRSILSLFLRFGFFKCDDTVKDIEHCDVEISFAKDSNAKQLCESFFFKSLDHLSTLNTDQHKKTEHLSNYLELLSFLAHYLQSLVSCKKITAMSPWTEEMQDVWSKTFKRIETLNKGKTSTRKNQEVAFLLLYLYLGFHMLSDFKTSSDLLQDVFVCEEKSSTSKKKSSKKEQSEEPQWIEVLTEILLQLLSLQSHLARVVSSMIFRLIVSHLNTEAVQLIVQTLIPKKRNQDDAGGVLVENDEADEEGNEEEGSSDEEELLDDDVADDEESDDDDKEDDNDKDDDDEDSDEEENMDVDENFRESVKQALGKAGVPEENEEDDEDLPDLSDSEMFQLDEVLAEVFRQRKKSGGKKAREEKKKELENFRFRVLDLVEVMIKSESFSYFVFDLLRPLLLLILTSRGAEEQSARDKARSVFNLLKSHSKGVTDTGHSKEEQLEIFQELIDLARTVNDSSQLPIIATACSIVIKTSDIDCQEVLSQTLSNVISKKQSKPLPIFFSSLFESESMSFQPLSSILLTCLSNKEAKMYSQTLSCTLLASLAKKTGNVSSDTNKTQWMIQAASLASQELESVEKGDLKAMFLKEVMTLTLALLARTDVLSLSNFGECIKPKLMEVKSKMNTDSRRLANKIIAALDRLKSLGKKQQEKVAHPQKHKRDKSGDSKVEVKEPKKKKRKKENSS